MSSFAKGITFTMGGTKYEVLAEGGTDLSSNLVYVPCEERETADPRTLVMWKAEAKLARGDILINDAQAAARPHSPYSDSLQQIADLKRRIYAIERRRVNLLKIDDPESQVLLRDNIVRPNKSFDIWTYTRSSYDPRPKREIQHMKIHGILLAVQANSAPVEHFHFDISDQFESRCQTSGDTLTTQGTVKVELAEDLRTVHGLRPSFIPGNLGGHIVLDVELKALCKYAVGTAIINACIARAAYVRDVKAPGLKMNKIAFPEIGDHMIAIVGVCLEIYADDQAA